ncbi:RNA polymerase subunit sigma-70 [Janthinobacterium sp. BJB412]|nr:RNA polymerase subunit sigma-70 [Janthinobacterium sp. BJB412]
MMIKDLDDWFVAEVLPLEGMLTQYLRRNWRNHSELADLRQEVYVRVYEAAGRARPLRAAPFVMATARHLLIDRARRQQLVEIDSVADLPELGMDELSPERHAAGRAELDQLWQALAALPPRCREVVRLRKMEGLSQREVAAKMGIKEDTVEKQIAKGMRALVDAMLLADGATRASPPPRWLRQGGKT